MAESRRVILEGVVGSRAYGLAHADSDTDLLGIFVDPLPKVLSVGWRPGTAGGKLTGSGDSAYHEVAKYLSLAAAGNPTILELLFLEGYTLLHHLGTHLVNNRHLFMTQRIRRTYGGYAMQQYRKMTAPLSGKTPKRKAKHARHLLRLLIQGEEALRTGKITVRLSNPDFVRRAGELPDQEMGLVFQEHYDRLNAVESTLPEEPDMERINEILFYIRMARAGV